VHVPNKKPSPRWRLMDRVVFLFVTQGAIKTIEGHFRVDLGDRQRVRLTEILRADRPPACQSPDFLEVGRRFESLTGGFASFLS
jgi:hypothetical protein